MNETTVDKEDLQELVAELKSLGDITSIFKEALIKEVQTTEGITKRLNALLISRLVQDMQIKNLAILDILEEEDDWQNDDLYVSDVKYFIMKEFGFLKQSFKTLFAIGDMTCTTPTEEHIKEYIAEAYFLSSQIWKVLYFTLLSEIWKLGLQQNTDVQRIVNRMFSSRSPKLDGIVKHVERFVEVLKDQEAAKTIPFWNFLEKIDYAKLVKYGKRLEELRKNRNGTKGIQRALDAEIKLSHLLKPLIFLQGYDLLSIKNVLYRKIREHASEYLFKSHRLGMKEGEEKWNIKHSMDVNNSVVLVEKKAKGNLADNWYTNLTPFVFDNKEEEGGFCELLFYFRNDIDEDNPAVEYSHVNVEKRSSRMSIPLKNKSEVLQQDYVRKLVNLFLEEVNLPA